MPFFILFLLFNIVLTLAGVMLGCWLMAEYLPALADVALDAARGTPLAFLGDWTAKALLVIAKYAGMFLNIMIEWLKVLGIDLESLKVTVEKAAENADATGESY